MMKNNLLETTLWTALITPLNENRDVNYDELHKLLKMQEEAHNGIVILGSTGEALNLSDTVKDEILKFSTSLNLNVPIMAGVGGINLHETKKYIEKLNAMPFDAYLLVTPLYAKPGTHGQYHWFKELLDTSIRPCMLYNVPSRTAVKMSFEAIEMLKDHPNFYAIKEASGSVDDFQKFVNISEKIAVYSGDDALLPEFAPLGAKGLVSVAGNIWPHETNYYVKKCLNNSLTLFEKTLWQEASNSLFIASNPVPIKRLMWQQKIIETPNLMPPLNHNDCQDQTILKKFHLIITDRFQDQNEVLE